MSEERRSQAAKANRIAVQTALIQLDMDRKTLETESGINSSALNRLQNGENPEGWQILGPFFASKGYQVPNLEILSLPLELSLAEAGVPLRRLLVDVLAAGLNEQQVAQLQATVDGFKAEAAVQAPVSEPEQEEISEAETAEQVAESADEGLTVGEAKAVAQTEEVHPGQAEGQQPIVQTEQTETVQHPVL